MTYIHTLDHEHSILDCLNRGVDGAPWERAPECDTPGELAFKSSPCNPFACDSPQHWPGSPPIPCRHIERFPR